MQDLATKHWEPAKKIQDCVRNFEKISIYEILIYQYDIIIKIQRKFKTMFEILKNIYHLFIYP